jgi:protocatechuate 3,4-dioxygenase beta subunit
VKSNRRNVLIGIGAGVGLAGLALGAGGWRTWRSHPLDYGFGDPGASIEGLGRLALRCTPGTTTSEQIEGPFYSPRTPERRDIRDPFVARSLIVAGRVLDQQCRPIAGAVLDFWQTDQAGRYDNQGYRYRGHQRSDEAGRFELVTVRPHAYTALSISRTPHIHVKVQAANTGLLTTQLYLPDAEETNVRDRLYSPTLAIHYVSRDADVERATFDFVLHTV